ncbi:ABC transporter permease [Anaerocolumna sedimenticola]|uniref:ABC transporter permease n=1 Tax=Anaerocolumna sedimenticola TaxID=2696063 RepID=A0A6P1TTA3_9FIRM|nr:ABC transporter permease [Anaerocolumna sedimenticola]QHQ63181.1 ABC transporter permease [Anaerocolumna sedimenticola]
MSNIKSMWKKITGYRLFLPIFCLIIVLIINLIKTPAFFQITIKNGILYGYIIDIINRSSELIVLAVGMTLVVAASAGTDISVGAVSALSGAVCVYALVGSTSASEYRMPYFAALLLAALTGMLCGAWNGFLVAKLKIQPMVATLILFTAGRGIAQVLTQGFILYVRTEQFKYLGNSIPGVPLPTPVFIAFFVVAITAFVMKKTALGLYIQTVGINAKAARLVGLNSSFIQFLSYTFCGLCAGIAGMIITSRVYSIDANNAGLNIELDAILAVAIGGNSLGGGKFSLTGSVIGAITIQALTTSLYAMKVTADQLPVYKAVVVIIIVALQSPELKRMYLNTKNRSVIKDTGKKVAE